MKLELRLPDYRMVFFTLFIVLPTEEVCTLRRISSGASVNEIKSRLELAAGLPSQIYHLCSSHQHKLDDDYVLELHYNVWNGFLYRVEIKEEWRALFGAVVREDVDWLIRKGRVCATSDGEHTVNNRCEAKLDVEERGCVALYLASWLGSSKMCQCLLSAGVNPNGATRNNRTPLFAAVARGNSHILNILLDHGAKFSVRDSNGDTPLDVAKQNSAKQCIKRILSAHNIFDFNLKAKDTSISTVTVTDSSISLAHDEVGHENSDLRVFPKVRPVTAHERVNSGCVNTLNNEPNTGFSRRSTNLSNRSVTFKFENEHSVRSRNDGTRLPDVHLRTSNARVRSSNGVRFGVQKARDTRITNLSNGTTLRSAKAIPKSASAKTGSRAEDAVVWNSSTTALDFLYIRPVVGKKESFNKFDHSNKDLDTAVEAEANCVADNRALLLTIPQNEQTGETKSMCFNIDTPNLSTAETEQIKVAKKTDRCPVAINLTSEETGKGSDAMETYTGTPRLNATVAQNQQSNIFECTDANTPELDLVKVEDEIREAAKKIDYGTPACNLPIEEHEQDDDANPTDLNIHALNLSTTEREPTCVDRKTNHHLLAQNADTCEIESSQVSGKVNRDLALNLTPVETDLSDDVSTESRHPSPELTSEATLSKDVSFTDANTCDENNCDGNTDSAPKVRRDSKTNIPCSSGTDIRPETAACGIIRSKQGKCKSAGMMKTAARKILIAEHRKRTKSASEKNAANNLAYWKKF